VLHAPPPPSHGNATPRAAFIASSLALPLPLPLPPPSSLGEPEPPPLSLVPLGISSCATSSSPEPLLEPFIE
jgi:hypothetical protein